MSNFWKDKSVLVAGGTGFIGSHAVDALVARGAHVSIVASPRTTKERVRKNLGSVLSRIKIHYADLSDYAACDEVIRGRDVILNFAAIDGGKMYKLKHAADIFQVNTAIVLNLLKASLKNKVERILLMSSSDVYSGSSKKLYTEKDTMRFVVPNAVDGYAWSKRLTEVAARLYFEEYDLKIAIARPGNVYGPLDHADDTRGRVIPRFISQALQGQDITIFGRGLQQKSFLYVTDLVDGLLSLTERYAVCEPVNVASSRYITIKALAEMILKKIDGNSTLSFQNTEDLELVTSKIDIRKFKRVIGMKEKVSLDEGLDKTIAYFKNDTP